MPFVAENDLVHYLRETNRRLRLWLETLPALSAGPVEHVITPEQMSGLLSELMRAGERLRSLPREQDKDANLSRELADYRSHVERLQGLLPAIHAALLRERARLEQERSRLASASEWAERSRQTL